MKEAIHFIYNGTHSKDMGVMNIHDSSGLYSDKFFSPFQLNNNSIQQTGSVIASQYNNEPIEFSMSLYFDNYENKEYSLNRVIKWLKGNSQFLPLSFESHPNYLVYAKLKSIDDIQHNGVYEGIIQITMSTNSHYIYSQPYLTEIFTVTNSFQLMLNHEGVIPTEPKIWVEKIGKGNLEIFNKTTNKRFLIEGIDNKEKLFIDNKKRIIYSNGELVGIHRGINHNRVWLELDETNFDGTNELIITGSTKIQFELQYSYYTTL